MVTTRPGRGAAAANEIIVAVPVELKSLVEPMRALIATLGRRSRAAGDGAAVDYREIEQEVAEQTAAVERAAHQCMLTAVDVDAEHIEVESESFVRVGYGNGTYFTMAGPIEIVRPLYRKLGCRNAKVVDAISLRTGAIGKGWLPWTAQAMAHLHQQGTSREAEQTARQLGRLPYSRASFERVPHELGELYLEHRTNIENQLIGELKIPNAATSVSVSLDRTSVPMEEPAKRPPGRPRKNAPKRPVTRQFRMAYCGTVTLHDREGKALHTIRYAQMPNREPQQMCNSMANDIYRLRERRPDLKLAELADGAPEMWHLLEPSFPTTVFGPAHRSIDFWHLMEKLAAAARVVGRSKASIETLRRRWRRLLRTRTDASQVILHELLDSGRENVVVDCSRPVHEAITYLRNNAERMNYAGALKKGLPIASGNVEASCKTVIGIRMKRCGSRWKAKSGDHVLHLRALALSDRWDSAMAKLMATQRTAVRRLAA